MPSRAARIGACAALAAGVTLTCAAAAGDWPSRPLHLVVPVAAGGRPDVVARALAQEVAKQVRQPVIVENRPGAQTNIGIEAVARAEPDGYTYLLAPTSLLINPQLSEVAFDPLRDFAPVAMLSRSQFLLAVRPTLAAATAEDLVALARSHPGMSCAHVGGATELACALFAALARAPLVQVPYRGSTLALVDLARGDVDLQFLNLAAAEPYVRDGRIRALAVTDPALGGEPLEGLPPLERALRGFEVGGWLGVMAPAGTPPQVLRRMNEEIGAALATPGVKLVLAHDGVPAARASPEAFGAFLRREQARYERIIRGARLRAH